MKKPDVVILDTLIKLNNSKYDNCIKQLKCDVLPMIRLMESKGVLQWFCFLLHDRLQLSDRLPKDDENYYIHLRLNPRNNDYLSSLKMLLTSKCVYTKKAYLGKIAGVRKDLLKDNDWLNAWWIIGEISDMALKLIEAHKGDEIVPVEQFLQFYHYATNMITLGGRFVLFPGPIYRI
jgi:hypothetical protein